MARGVLLSKCSFMMFYRHKRIEQAPVVAATVGRGFPIRATLVCRRANFSVYARNAAAIELLLLSGGNKRWRRWIDTALPSPNEICEWNQERAGPDKADRLYACSAAVLIAREGIISGITTLEQL